jgi:hypothetical protein
VTKKNCISRSRTYSRNKHRYVTITKKRKKRYKQKYQKNQQETRKKRPFSFDWKHRLAAPSSGKAIMSTGGQEGNESAAAAAAAAVAAVVPLVDTRPSGWLSAACKSGTVDSS